jgi:hypothetical protein
MVLCPAGPVPLGSSLARAACTTAHTACQEPVMMMFRALVSARCLPM